MSHAALNWLTKIPADDLTDTEFRLLFFVCVLHGRERGDLVVAPPEFLQTRASLTSGQLASVLASLFARDVVHVDQDGVGKNYRIVLAGATT